MTNGSNDDAWIGCLGMVGLLLLLTILAMFFPVARAGIAKPVVDMWEGMLGVSLPAFNTGPIIVVSGLVLLVAIVFGFAAVLIAGILNAVFVELDLDLQTWGAVASILGLAVGIVSVVLQYAPPTQAPGPGR